MERSDRLLAPLAPAERWAHDLERFLPPRVTSTGVGVQNRDQREGLRKETLVKSGNFGTL